MKPKTWVELPSSKYDIDYVLTSEMIVSSPTSSLSLNPKKLIQQYLKKKNNRIWKRTLKISPFERKIIELDKVTRRDGYGDGTAVMYIREIFEPGDVEYDYISDYVCAAQLSHEQVDRLRIMIIPPRREAILVSYLDHYKNINQQQNISNQSTDIVRHFEAFHRRYLKLSVEEGKEKFDTIFSFTFAIITYGDWVLKSENIEKRLTMIATLAKYWRKLLGKYTPSELGTVL